VLLLLSARIQPLNYSDSVIVKVFFWLCYKSGFVKFILF
jgi:hypothetical protein